jgi:hypothetical protein
MANPGPSIEGQPMTLAAVAPGVGRFPLPFYRALTTIAAADLITNYVFGFKGRIVQVDFVVGVAAATAGKAATLTPRLVIGGTTVNITGGVVALTTANCTPAGTRVLGSPITALNSFGPLDGFTLTGSAVTAFSEGDGMILVHVVNDDTLNALSRQGILFPINP